jgi:hypothetical protein
MNPMYRDNVDEQESQKLGHDNNFTGTVAAAHEAASASPVPTAGGVSQISKLREGKHYGRTWYRSWTAICMLAG